MINFVGIASVILFYLLILAVGMWAARKNTGGGDQEVSYLNADTRSIPFLTCCIKNMSIFQKLSWHHCLKYCL